MTYQDHKERGELAYRKGRFSDAEREFHAALQAADDANDERNALTAACLLAKSLDHLHKTSEAKKMQDRALALSVKLQGESSVEHADVLRDQATTLINCKQFAEAEKLLRSALSIFRERLGPEDQKVARTLRELGRALYLDGHLVEAEPVLAQALGLTQKLFGTDDLEYGNCLRTQAHFFAAKGNHTLAEIMFRRSLAVLENCSPADHPRIGRTLIPYSATLLLLGRSADSLKQAKRALTIIEGAFPADHPDYVIALNQFASASFEAGNIKAAQDSYEKALHLSEAESKEGNGKGNLLMALSGMGMCKLQLANFVDAEPYFERAKALITEAEKNHKEKELVDNLVNCYMMQGKLKKAVHLMPDQMKAQHESHLASYVTFINKVMELGERFAWKKDKE